MISQLQKLLASCRADTDGIYSGMGTLVSAQAEEIGLRERVAAQHYDDYFAALSLSHSIPVMDREVDFPGKNAARSADSGYRRLLGLALAPDCAEAPGCGRVNC